MGNPLDGKGLNPCFSDVIYVSSGSLDSLLRPRFLRNKLRLLRNHFDARANVDSPRGCQEIKYFFLSFSLKFLTPLSLKTSAMDLGNRGGDYSMQDPNTAYSGKVMSTCCA